MRKQGGRGQQGLVGSSLPPPALQSPSNTFPVLQVTPTTMNSAAAERREKLGYQDHCRVPHI